MRLYHRTLESMYRDIEHEFFDIIDTYGDGTEFIFPDIFDGYIDHLTLKGLKKVKDEETERVTLRLIAKNDDEVALKDIGLENAVYLFDCVDAGFMALTYGIEVEKKTPADELYKKVKALISEMEGKSITIDFDYFNFQDFINFSSKLRLSLCDGIDMNKDSYEDEEESLNESSEEEYEEEYDEEEFPDRTVTFSFSKIDDRLALIIDGTAKTIEIFTDYLNAYELLSFYDLFHQNL